MKNALKASLKKLSSLHGVCGAEEAVIEYLYKEFRNCADTVTIDPLGNLIAEKHGHNAGPKLMLSAHADEVGMCVKNILSNGFILFEKIGALADKILPAREVRIITRNGELPGIIGEKSLHLQSAEEQQKQQSSAALFIDIGASTKEEAERAGVKIGDRIVIKQEFTELLNPDIVCTKAIDNRISCAIVLELFRNVQASEFDGTLCAVITVQEERAFTGSWYVGNTVQADYAIVLDTIPTMDTPGSAPEMAHPVWLGRGPACPVSYGGGLMQYTYFHIHPRMRELIEEHSEKTGIAVQFLTALGNYGTDAPLIARSNQGTPTATFCVPRRYSHSPYEVTNMNDAAGAYQILKSIIYANGHKSFSFLKAADDQ